MRYQDAVHPSVGQHVIQTVLTGGAALLVDTVEQPQRTASYQMDAKADARQSAQQLLGLMADVVYPMVEQ
ncbi:MAG: hypothetical protein M1835_001776, partial [Candelina submexicana]